MRFFRNKDGAAAVEFGLVAPIVVAVLIGVVTYGGTILAYSRMRQAISRRVERSTAWRTSAPQ